MKSPTIRETLFSLKSFAASMLALYLAYRIGLPRPFWAMTTAYVVSNPLSGAVRSKAVYRVGGTAIGSAVTILLVPLLADSPELLTLTLALWVGLCLFVSLLDRTPRTYVFMLAGYTAALIGFPTVTDPASIFDVALARVEEITLGIVCATLVHSLVFPQSLGPELLDRLDRAIDDAQRWIGDTLTGSEARGERERSRLAIDITELRLMATHLPFDTSNLRWVSNAIRALQDRLAAIVPLLSAIEDRLQTLRRTDGAALSPDWQALLNNVAEWSRDGSRIDPRRAEELRQAIAAMAPDIGPDASWSQALKVNLAARLRALVDAWEECRELRGHIGAAVRGIPPAQARQPVLSLRALHRDYGLALLSALAAVIAITAVCAFWIATAWPAGAAAAMMAAVFCSFYATQDDPVPGIKTFMNYTLVSVPISALYLLVILPAVHSFEMLMLVTAPLLLLLGILVARPTTSARAMATLFGVAGTLGLQDTGTADLVSFINSMLGQLAGITAAAMFTKLFRSVSAEWTASRLLRAGWSELAQLGRSLRAPSVAEFSARMLDRIGLLMPRLAVTGPRQDLNAIDALGDLRIGLNMTELLRLQPRLEQERVTLRPVMHALSEHFRKREDMPASAEPALLDQLDAALRAVCAAAPAAEKREAVAALAGIRRDIFPDAAPYQPAYRNEAIR